MRLRFIIQYSILTSQCYPLSFTGNKLQSSEMQARNRRRVRRLAVRGPLRRSKRLEAKRNSRLLGKCEGENLFQRLPPELMVHILRQADVETIYSASRVNKFWRDSARVAQPRRWDQCAAAMARSIGIPRLQSVPLLIDEFHHQSRLGCPLRRLRFPSPIRVLNGSACGRYLVIVLDDSTVVVFTVEVMGNLKEMFRQPLGLPAEHLPTNVCFIPSVNRVSYTTLASPPSAGTTRLFLPPRGHPHSPTLGVNLLHTETETMDANIYAFEDSYIAGFYTVKRRLFKKVVYLWVPGENPDAELSLPDSWEILPTRTGVYDLSEGAYGRPVVSFTDRRSGKREVLYSAPSPAPGMRIKFTAHPFGPSSSFVLRRFDYYRGIFGVVLEPVEGDYASGSNGALTINRVEGRVQLGHGGPNYEPLQMEPTTHYAAYPGGFCESRSEEPQALLCYYYLLDERTQLPSHITIEEAGMVMIYHKGPRKAVGGTLPA